jgi:hypothetical protein
VSVAAISPRHQALPRLPTEHEEDGLNPRIEVLDERFHPRGWRSAGPVAPQQGRGQRRLVGSGRSWNSLIARTGDISLVLLLAILGIVVLLSSKEAVDQGKALLTAAGLFGIGHGAYTSARMLQANRK